MKKKQQRKRPQQNKRHRDMLKATRRASLVWWLRWKFEREQEKLRAEQNKVIDAVEKQLAPYANPPNHWRSDSYV